MSLLVGSVAVPRPVRRLFTYSIPAALAPRCLPGVRVIVPFGRRLLTGYLLDVRQPGKDEDAVTLIHNFADLRYASLQSQLAQP